MTVLTRIFRAKTLRQAREAAQKAHNDALRAGDTRRQAMTLGKLKDHGWRAF